MPIPIVSAILDIGLKLLDRAIPDPAAKAAAQLEFMRLQQAGEFKEMDVQLASIQAQTNINAVEASNPSILVSGWRPMFGWICVAAFGVNFLVVPLLAWLSPLLDIPPPSRLDISELFPPLMGMLGLSTMRMNEKIKGVASV